jgi:hypothetical protein
MKTTLTVENDYDPASTDPESLARKWSGASAKKTIH